MPDTSIQIMISDESIINKIYLIRDKKVMLDRDLAELYGVETRALKQSVRRNLKRFPEDFMFEMTEKEFEKWRSQFVTSKSDLMGLRHSPFCFTEQGVTMLSCILNSDRAIEVNILIIRVFTKMRELLLTHKEILLKLEQLEKKFIKHDDEIELIFNALKELIKPQHKERKRIGYKLPEKQK